VNKYCVVTAAALLSIALAGCGKEEDICTDKEMKSSFEQIAHDTSLFAITNAATASAGRPLSETEQNELSKNYVIKILDPALVPDHSTSTTATCLGKATVSVDWKGKHMDLGPYPASYIITLLSEHKFKMLINMNKDNLYMQELLTQWPQIWPSATQH